MLEVICEDCQEVQRVDLFQTPQCRSCGSATLTGTNGYGTPETTGI